MSEISPGIEAEVAAPQQPPERKPGFFGRLFRRKSSSEAVSPVDKPSAAERLKTLDERERQVLTFLNDPGNTAKSRDADVLDEIRAKKSALLEELNRTNAS